VSRPASTAAFWIDEEYDRDQASDGISRFGAYVRRSGVIADCLVECNEAGQDQEISQARFAAAAWSTATTPVMSPGYVRRHPRVISAHVEFNAWDGTLTGAVELVTPWPQPLARSRDWQHGTWWQDWPTESRGGQEIFCEPSEQDLAAHAYLLASARLEFPLRLPARLPVPTGWQDNVEVAARETVAALVVVMNGVVAPVIETLERS
jgi:hypothetical protein